MLHSQNKNCKYFKSVTGCKFGTKCKFFHSNIPLETSSFNEQHEAVKEVPHFDEVESLVHVEELPIEPEITTDDAKGDEKVCFSFRERGWCRFGNKCKFLHKEQVAESKVKNADISPEQLTCLTLEDNATPHEKTQRRVCIYFQSGRCWNGNRCKFLHPVGGRNFQRSERSNVNSSRENKRVTVPVVYRTPVQNPRDVVLKREDASKDDLLKIRKVDTDVIKRRFGKKNITIVIENENENIYEINFSPTDPDWPFDAKLFKLRVNFPRTYPLQLFLVTLPLEQELPETVRRYVEVSIQEWITSKQKEKEDAGIVDGVFRTFMKWLDRALEDIVTEGLKQLKREMLAKAAGLTFVPVSQLKKELTQSDTDEYGESEEGENTDDEEEESEESDPEPFMKAYRKKNNVEDEVYTGPERIHRKSYDDDDSEDDAKGHPVLMEDGNPNSVRRGTEIRLKNLNMKENVASLEYMQIKIIIQCARCKTSSELETPVGRVNMIECSKCHQMQLLTFRPSLIHHFSSIIGYLDLDGCVPFDLVLQDSAFKATCLGCNKETKVEGIYPGQVQTVFCRSCHQKLGVEAESVRFSVVGESKFSTDDDIHQVSGQKVKKIIKDPVIQLGKPLPDEGTCKHYKKSFRWFRFPCCGKAYPCDICHEEKEQHEMVLANRMICGFCCKEQPYAADKPCSGCDSSLTRTRSSHWEGGKGCRDKIKMNRNDVKKYSSMNKTVSRKTQEKKNPKKKTKLRHTSN